MVSQALANFPRIDSPAKTLIMKKALFLLLFSLLAGGFPQGAQRAHAAAPTVSAPIQLPAGVDPELVKEAGNKAVKDLLTRLLGPGEAGSQPSPALGRVRRFAVLPLETDVDANYFTNQVRDQFAVLGHAAGFELYTRMDDEWNKILEEIGFGQKFEDTMDAVSVQKFGRIAGVQGLVMGRVVSVTKEGSDAKVRFVLRAFEVETGRLLWGGESTQYAKRDGSLAGQLERIADTDAVRRYWWVGLSAAVGLFLVGRILKAVGTAAKPR